MKIHGLLSIFLVMVLLLTNVGCGTSSVITTLNLIVVSSEAAINVLVATSTINPATGKLITTYLNSVSVAVDKATTILASSESGVQKAIDISNAFAGIAQPLLPAGTPQVIVSVVEAVVVAVENFLKSVGPISTTATAKVTAKGVKVRGVNQVFSGKDLATIQTIKQKNLGVMQTLKGLPY